MNDTIKQLSRRLGVSTDTIRHYRELGLLHPQIRENGYAVYGLDDMLRILVTREMRSMDISLPETQDFLAHRSMIHYNDWLTLREKALQERIHYLQLELARLQETKTYASCGVRLLGQVEEFDGPSTWAVCSIGIKNPYERGEVLSEWIEHFPFTYISATITLDDLLHTRDDTPYRITIGAGALEKYVRTFSLPLPDDAHFQPGGHFIRTCIVTRDVLHITPRDVAPLHEYARAHGMRFASCTGGRILFMNDDGVSPEYYLLIWVRVEPAPTSDQACMGQPPAST